MKITPCLLGIVVLTALASGDGRAAPAATGSAGGGKQDASDSPGRGNHGAQHGHDQGDRPGATAARQHKGAAAREETRNGASRPPHRGKAPDRNVAMAPSAGTKALATAAMTPSGLMPVSHLGLKAPSTNIVVAMPANVVSHTVIKASLGGPTAPDAKQGGLIVVGGTVMSRARARSGGNP